MKIQRLLSAVFLAALFPMMAMAAGTPRSEYPRPQFERKAWINLNGTWDFTFDFANSGLEHGYQKATQFDQNITVPFCPESKLSGVAHTDFINHIWYHRTIQAPAAWKGKRIMLNFGAVYFNSEVYIDGILADRHFGGSSSFSIDITRFVSDGAVHHLVVRASSDVRSAKQSAGKQNLQLHSYGCNYTRTTGIWQTVWMEAVDPSGLERVQVIPDIDQEQLTIHPQFFDESSNTLRVVLKDGNRTVSSAKVKATNSSTVILPVKKAKLWSPESPYLYTLLYQVVNDKGEVLDEVNSYVGMRKVHIEGNKIYLNNKPYYQRLVLDQGFYPDGIWTAPSDEALKKDIELSKQAGFNGARLHQKAFEERYYYWADKLGYITWGEAPSWGMDVNDIEVARNFIMEWSELVMRDRNHPSLLIWTPMNEQFWPDRVQYPRMTTDLYNITKALDPTRPVNDASGGCHIKTDIWTVHHYEQDPGKLKEILYKDGKFFQTPNYTVGLPAMNIGYNGLRENDTYEFPQYDGKMPYLIDEVGGIKWVKAQDKTNSDRESWGYGEPPRTEQEFMQRLEGLINAVLELGDHVWGYCYTQLTDVEQEQNGILYYDRTPKFDLKVLHNIFSKTPDDVQKP
jgi:beta-galactosidase/beta-glucuronidase